MYDHYYYYLKFILLILFINYYFKVSSFLLHSLNFIYFFDLFFSRFFWAQVIIFKIYPYWPVLFFSFKQLYQISNCAAFILYEHDVSIGKIWKRNIAFVFAVLFL